MYPNDRRYSFDDPLIEHHNPELPHAFAKLDVKDQHLIELSTKNGFLIGRNSILENRNYELEKRNKELEKTLEKTDRERQSYIDRFEKEREDRWEVEREVERLKQYEPKELAEGEDNATPELHNQD